MRHETYELDVDMVELVELGPAEDGLGLGR